jgi:signal transduction histidine kinase
MLTVVKMSLSFLKLPPTDTEGLNLLQNTKQVLSKAINDMSQLTKSLHSERIIQLGLIDSIKYELDVLKKNKLFGVHYKIEDDGYELDSKTTIFLFRMFQEIINNVIKHAQATDLFVTLDLLTDEYFLMKIEDNGKGIEGVNGWVDKQSLSGKSGIGLRSIIDRALLIGAKIEIHSRTQEGTSVTIKLPLKGQMLKYA